MNKKYNFAFWGTGPLAESVIYSLYQNQMIPKYIITKPDTKKEKNKDSIPSIIKTWAISKNIKVLQPYNIKKDTLETDFVNFINDQTIDFHIVASYGKILPNYILEIPNINSNITQNFKYKPFINIHPSDLPDLRGPSPVQYALMRGDDKITLTIMQMDYKMDEGDIITKNSIQLDNKDTLETVLRKAGAIAGTDLNNIIDLYLSGNVKTKKQDNNLASYCKFITKEQGNITEYISKKDIKNIEESLENKAILESDIKKIKNKYKAFTPWPGIFFYINKQDKKIRVKISKFNLESNTISECILNVIPEGKTEISFKDFLNSYNK